MEPGLILGFTAMCGLIVAVGPQNIFVFKLGLKRTGVLPVVAICVLADLVLVGCGVLGAGVILGKFPIALSIVKYSALGFLMLYVARHMYLAVEGEQKLSSDCAASPGRVVQRALAITFLNPHVYLDSVVFLGLLASTLAIDQKYWFILGAALASTLWFSLLGFGAGVMSPYFTKEKYWRYLDCASAAVLFHFCVRLVSE